ncbi:MAG: response regulator, partial [Bacteroidota bacterium]
ILMDINMPYLDGIQAMDAIFRVNSLVRILVLSGHTEAWVIRHSLNSGASGYLTKKVSQVEIIDAIMAVHEGGAYLDMMSLDVILNDFDLTDEEESKSNPKKYSMN